MRARFAWLDGSTRIAPLAAESVSLAEATHVGLCTEETFSDTAEGAARLAECIRNASHRNGALLVLPARLAKPTGLLSRLWKREGANASKALRCTALRLAGFEIVQVIDEPPYDAVVGRAIT